MVFARPCVLVVDRQDTTSEVLYTVLSSRGVDVVSATAPDEGLRLAAQHRPDLIVLDLDLDRDSSEIFCGKFRAAGAVDTPLILLGAAREAGPVAACLAKPYHYGALVRRIEELLGEAFIGSRIPA